MKTFLTGGSGTLGKALLQYYTNDYTIFSRDPMKQMKLRAEFPDVHCVIGDVRDDVAVYRAMAGHDMVIHAAAMKHIPQAEKDPDACYEINVQGSRNVLDAALRHGIKDVVLISTDKACHPVNAYGCTKMMMERLAFSYVKAGLNVYIPRYGNVIDSTGSVVQVWHKQICDGGKITITDPEMTRFWLTPKQAVEVIAESMNYPNMIYIPRLYSLSILRLAQYVTGKGKNLEYTTIGLRPGEKMHEELLTHEESHYVAFSHRSAYILRDTKGVRLTTKEFNYSSYDAMQLTKEEVWKMLGLED